HNFPARASLVILVETAVICALCQTWRYASRGVGSPNQSVWWRNSMAMTPEQALRLAQEHGARMVDLKFTDVFGTWQHFSVPLRSFEESAFTEGVGFDGSSIRGFQEINESDMLLLPDASTAVMDPFTAEPTLSLVCDVTQPGVARTPYT